MFPMFTQATGRMECQLEPGEVLYLPGLWFHDVTALSPSVAVNIFWRALPTGEYDPKDLYGNRDLLAGMQAKLSASSVGKLLAHLPQPYRAFYAEQAIAELKAALG
ncbi:hypothetical protein CYMTET_41217 [Cymbomonas tetramitiformis]|uniref:JmjC domain-containing protein n=1 Tax=Cymbomonas tetramitiformis TaxID=36881 RepID=A0AAE0F2V6_9CHLO|nr:hypothetical protein CYMTET_41217 [Cymbomonas tetramitiformis]